MEEFGFETTDEHLLRWLLRHQKLRKTLEELRVHTEAEQLEIILANRVAIVRMDARRGWSLRDAVGHIGAPLISGVRELSMVLGDLADAMADAGEDAAGGLTCPACDQDILMDPHRCSGCGTYMHRGCLEMVEGCTTVDCPDSPDAIPALADLNTPAAEPPVVVEIDEVANA